MKKVLITGASGALGREVCRAFLDAGATVIAITRNHPLPDFQNEKGKIISYSADLTDEAVTDKLLSTIVKEYGKIDAGIFLAGGYEGGTLQKTDAAALHRMFSLNFESAFHISGKIFTHMEQWGGGRLVFIGARPAIESKTATGSIAYALSKTLIIKLSELYNATGRKSGIVSGVFIPSVIDTPANRKNDPDADFSKWADPRKIAQNILFFCSTNGEILREGVFKVYGDA